MNIDPTLDTLRAGLCELSADAKQIRENRKAIEQDLETLKGGEALKPAAQTAGVLFELASLSEAHCAAWAPVKRILDEIESIDEDKEPILLQRKKDAFIEAVDTAQAQTKLLAEKFPELDQARKLFASVDFTVSPLT